MFLLFIRDETLIWNKISKLQSMNIISKFQSIKLVPLIVKLRFKEKWGCKFITAWQKLSSRKCHFLGWISTHRLPLGRLWLLPNSLLFKSQTTKFHFQSFEWLARWFWEILSYTFTIPHNQLFWWVITCTWALIKWSLIWRKISILLLACAH